MDDPNKISEDDKNAMETNIMMALFHCTVDQQEMLNGKYRQMAKMCFNKWNKEGNKLQKVLDKSAGESGQEYFDEVKEVIFDSIDELRTFFTSKIVEKNKKLIAEKQQ